MSRTLFIGDSHTCGYKVDSQRIPTYWSENNYAEIYSQVTNKKVAIYGFPGGCNRKYPTWVKSMLDYYNDIDEIFIQSTYWGRYLLGFKLDKKDWFIDSINPDHFLFGPNGGAAAERGIDPLIDKWTDIKNTDEYIELVEQNRDMEPLKPFKWDPYSPQHAFSPTKESYSYTKLWFENLTHLQYKEFCGDLMLIDTMCRDRNITWHLWNINDRVFIPENYQFYGTLKNCKRSPKSAQQFIQETHKINIEEHTTDNEHYTYDVHKTIATEYIPYLQGKEK